jgi:hypothetical protein
VRVAEVPLALITVDVIGSGGENEKFVSVRFEAVTVSIKGDPAIAAFGESAVTYGTSRIVSGAGEVAVTPPTVTDIAPLVALAGISTTSVVEVAETTVSATPFRVTASADGVALNPWP